MSCKWGGNTNTITSEGKEKKKKTDKKDSYKICHTCSTFLQILK